MSRPRFPSDTWMFPTVTSWNFLSFILFCLSLSISLFCFLLYLSLHLSLCFSLLLFVSLSHSISPSLYLSPSSSLSILSPSLSLYHPSLLHPLFLSCLSTPLYLPLCLPFCLSPSFSLSSPLSPSLSLSLTLFIPPQSPHLSLPFIHSFSLSSENIDGVSDAVFLPPRWNRSEECCNITRVTGDNPCQTQL